MAEIGDISQAAEGTKIKVEQPCQLPSQREYYEHRRRGDRRMELVIKAFFTYVYALFAFAYLFGYKDHLEAEFERGLWFLLRSDPFWSFQRDSVLLAIGYFLMLFGLRRLLFNKSNAE